MNYNQAMFNTLPLTIMLHQISTRSTPGFQPNRRNIHPSNPVTHIMDGNTPDVLSSNRSL
jgi:hypothetical protein